MRFLLPLVAVATFLAAPAPSAQTTFVVTSVGPPFAYTVDGDQSPNLTLTRGETYVFDVSGVASIHPFYISESETGGDGGSEQWEGGVTNNGATGDSEDTEVTFVVPNDAPDLLYYQCGFHQGMGAELNIINPSATEEDPAARFDLSVVSQNPGDRQVTVGLSLAEPTEISVEVFDIRGRRVAVLHDGALAAGSGHRFVVGQNLRPGVYVVRATDGERMAELSVTLVR